MHKARVTQPIRSSSRSQTGAHAYHVAASPEPEAIEGVGLIYFAEMRCSFLTSRLGVIISFTTSRIDIRTLRPGETFQPSAVVVRSKAYRINWLSLRPALAIFLKSSLRR